MKRRTLYYKVFFPKFNLPFKKLRWVLMVMIQEARMKKWRSILRFFTERKYHEDIMVLCRLLSKARLTSEEKRLPLNAIQFSHSINYPDWVNCIERRIWNEGLQAVPKLKVIKHKGAYLVVDGNHRLKAMKRCFPPAKTVLVRELKYVK